MPSKTLKRKYSQVTILGGIGGRIDHHWQYSPCRKVCGKVALVTKDGLLIGLSSSHACKLNGPVGSIVSMVPWGEVAKVQTSGLKYPINNEVLKIGSRGISNEISGSPSSIYVSSGTILLFIEKSIRFCFNHHDTRCSNSKGNEHG